MRGRSQCTTYVYEALYRGAAPGAACRRARRSGTGRRRRHRAAWRPLRAAGRAHAAAPSHSALRNRDTRPGRRTGSVGVGLDARGVAAAWSPPRPVILLDTNALIWVEQGRGRVRSLVRSHRRLYVSPANLLELQFLIEAGRIRLRRGNVSELAEDERWTLDDPPAASWFAATLDLDWTRDPFDRLLVAHARLRGWRLATSDTVLL